MDDMLKEFVVEALDLATNVEEHLLSLERNPGDKNTLNAVFRSFHTIKGGAGFMNLSAMVSACHLTENLFDALRTGEVAVTPEAIEAALEASGFVADQLTALNNGTQPEQLSTMPKSLEKMLTDAIESKGVSKKAAQAKAAPVVVAAAPASPAPAPAPVSADGIDWQAYYQAVTPAVAAPISAPTVTVESTPIPEIPLNAVFKEETEAVKTSLSNAEIKQNAPAKEESIRIDAVKLNVLLEVAGESVQAANQAAVLLEKLSQFKFDGQAAPLMSALTETLTRASRYSTELQRATLATRMQPVGRLFQKFPRLVRELARDLGKEVDLNISGAETEVDRVVVDSLYDPLVHMLRNALDHGIETSEDRLSSNKSARSTISLKAWQEASSVMIEVSDDGKGMDAQRLRDKAISKGLINAHDARTDDEAFQLVFLPGFSTKEVASSVSGRGVGMDVVKTAVERHRGAIRIASELGKGTTFLIRLPIELSIVPTMLVRTDGASLALPMATVQRVVELPETFESVGGQPVLRDLGRPLPVKSLGKILGYMPSTERVGIVIAAPNPYILSVDAVDGTADLVIKPLTCISTPGITGTARSAEGELVLVISLSFLIDGCKVREMMSV
ncbi:MULTISPECIES: chemotaxis protein CheA [unclassified Undibacterium]|uniref:chemotaxis protein CheA n=1 Tax=unclassified Undibacterium TaxID=2630295 RepID=UPI002AC89B6D|nr:MULTISPECIES: chemotaxis protein CheA [unclassified Undibacterium]MEB0141054.1 chemotaxis protein CheA [Undibacterium sp. CCC2.1]MEB0174034.1 chemotaxis protein CheA [Undibacterium sp. CCC1.1]MEB0178003.1 chemotaxis protein CheA [Undibacterium sp. CCC3.4]MEB0217225.1 chemotaxis protein CheA [Undibacterium sp. 5I2]WPX43278.1 chemotaxis protein CheA [Undibacterium sp. CCC3.4]